MRALAKTIRRWQLAAMRRIDADALVAAGARRAVRRFQSIARAVPAYRAILSERGVQPEQVRSPDDFTRLAPILEKRDLFGRYPIEALCVGGKLGELASVLTSSGQGGQFAFGLSTAGQARHALKAVDLALEHAFQTDQRTTLLINALPMGVRFACSTATIAETSVREDMVVALVDQFAKHYDQLILVTDPLFCKRILDHAREVGLCWDGQRVHAVLGEETFGEAYRTYIAQRLGQDPEDWDRGFVGSSMGVAELGLNLFFETRETVRLRQLASRQPQILQPALGRWPGHTPPLLFVHDPLRIFVEIDEPDAEGFGGLTLSTLDPSLVLPLLRYRTGDRAKVIDRTALANALRAAGLGEDFLPPLPMIAVAGRMRDCLPDGRTLLDVKDALYRYPRLADQLSGALRIEPGDGQTACHVHVQLAAGWDGDETELRSELSDCLPKPLSGQADVIQVWRNADFPFAQRLDYERKLDYVARAASGQSPCRDKPDAQDVAAITPPERPSAGNHRDN